MLVIPSSADDRAQEEQQQRRRRMLPVGMEETLLEESEEKEGLYQLKYQVTKGGLLASEIVPGSHLGTVSFEQLAVDQKEGDSAASKTTRMVWDVTFDTMEEGRTGFWQAVTENTISETCNNFQASVATPKLYRRITKLIPPDNKKITFEQIMQEWMSFCWEEGAGFPLPIPPICVGEKKDARWIVPPFLKERIVSSKVVNRRDDDDDTSASYAELIYQVDNPSWFTYQVHSHLGRVRFQSNDEKDGSVTMTWDIEIRPYRGWSSLVQAFTGVVVSCYSRNFKCHVREGADAMVSLKPPRGSGDTFLQIRKDSWLGGVMDAHLKDKRSTVDQTLAIFQPWTWGRSRATDEEGEGESWTEGCLT